MKSQLYLAGLLLSVLAIQSCTPDSNTAPPTNNNPATCPLPYRTGTTLSYTSASGTVTNTENWVVVGDTTSQGIPMKIVNTTRTASGQTQVTRGALGKVGGTYYSNFFSAGLYTPGSTTTITNSSGLVTIYGKTDQPVGHTWTENVNLNVRTDASLGTGVLINENIISISLPFTVTETNSTLSINGTTYTNVTKVSVNRTQSNTTNLFSSGRLVNTSTSSYAGTTDLWFDCSRGLLKSESTTRTTTPGQPANPSNSSTTIASYNY